jgi:hypothetical protein
MWQFSLPINEFENLAISHLLKATIAFQTQTQKLKTQIPQWNSRTSIPQWNSEQPTK